MLKKDDTPKLLSEYIETLLCRTLIPLRDDIKPYSKQVNAINTVKVTQTETDDNKSTWSTLKSLNKAQKAGNGLNGV